MVSFDGATESSIPCASILRECLKHGNLTNILLQSNQLFELLAYAEKSNFDQASDSLSLVEVCVICHHVMQ